MTDYLLVMAMMAIALIAVLIALILDDRERDAASASGPEPIPDLQLDEGLPEALDARREGPPETPEPPASQGT